MENKHFISFRKASEIKFLRVVGPFIIKSKVALLVVESLLKGMDFKTYFVVDYDPLHVISIRKQVNKNKTFEHQEVEGLAEKTNWSNYLDPMENVEAPEENPLAIVKTTKDIAPIASSIETTTPRNFSEAMEIEEEEESSKTNKRQKVEAEGELVEVIKTETQKKQVKVKGPVFEIQHCW